MQPNEIASVRFSAGLKKTCGFFSENKFKRLFFKFFFLNVFSLVKCCGIRNKLKFVCAKNGEYER